MSGTREFLYVGRPAPMGPIYQVGDYGTRLGGSIRHAVQQRRVCPWAYGEAIDTLEGQRTCGDVRIEPPSGVYLWMPFLHLQAAAS